MLSLTQRFEYADDRVPYAMTSNGSTYYMAYDQVGTLRTISDNSGSVIKQIDYDSFGNIINDTNPDLAVPFGFAGGLHDRDAGLVRFGFRDYSTELGRWTAKDPILFAGGDSNLYGYVQNDPVNLIDPEGLHGIMLLGRAPFINRAPWLRGGRIPRPGRLDNPIPKPNPKPAPNDACPLPQNNPPLELPKSWLGRLIDKASGLLGNDVSAGRSIAPVIVDPSST